MKVKDFTAKFKEGDILSSRGWIFIYAGLRASNILGSDEVRHAIIYHALIDKVCSYGGVVATRTGIGFVEGSNFRLANNSEKKLLFDCLDEVHVRWNPETKRMENIANFPF